MSNPYIGEIRICGFDFAPRNWAFCFGQLIPISQNTALFSLLGTTYGGDGRTTFALPDFQGRSPMHAGQGPGLSVRDLGEQGGTTSVTLLASEMPAHTHIPQAVSAAGTKADPTGNVWATPGATRGLRAYSPAPGAGSAMNALALTASGGNQPHNNLQPYLGLNFVICTNGVFPSRP